MSLIDWLLVVGAVLALSSAIAILRMAGLNSVAFLHCAVAHLRSGAGLDVVGTVGAGVS